MQSMVSHWMDKTQIMWSYTLLSVSMLVLKVRWFPVNSHNRRVVWWTFMRSNGPSCIHYRIIVIMGETVDTGSNVIHTTSLLSRALALLRTSLGKILRTRIFNTRYLPKRAFLLPLSTTWRLLHRQIRNSNLFACRLCNGLR